MDRNLVAVFVAGGSEPLMLAEDQADMVWDAVEKGSKSPLVYFHMPDGRRAVFRTDAILGVINPPGHG